MEPIDVETYSPSNKVDEKDDKVSAYSETASVLHTKLDADEMALAADFAASDEDVDGDGGLLASKSRPRMNSKKRRKITSDDEEFDIEEIDEVEEIDDFYVEESVESDVIVVKETKKKKSAAKKRKQSKGKGKKGKRGRKRTKAQMYEEDDAADDDEYASTDDENGLAEGLFGERDYSALQLRKDHEQRPIWVCPDGHVLLETFSPVYQQAYDFLIAVAEPSSRPQLMHEYQLTPYSMLAAVSIGLKTDDIINVLRRLSKTGLPIEVEDWIRECTSNHGKVKLVLRENRYFLETSLPDVLQQLLTDEEIGPMRVMHDEKEKSGDDEEEEEEEEAKEKKKEKDGGDEDAGQTSASKGDEKTFEMSGGIRPSEVVDPILQSDVLLDKAVNADDSDDDSEAFGGGANKANDTSAKAALTAVAPHVHSFEVRIEFINQIRRRCIELDLPAIEEYDFRKDSSTLNLRADLRPTTKLRDYQEKSLSKMFANGRARSGIIVLPCGAGKTLVGITAACTIKKRVMILCTTSVAVEQWRHQFMLWTDIDPKHISRFTADAKEPVPPCGITITTYSMMASHRSEAAKQRMEAIRNKDWGLLIFDEVQVMPAATFRKVLEVVPAHAKLGLTATLVREDDKIEHLNFLVGPKLYEANWKDLENEGHIARVACHEVWCPMTAEFYQEYLNSASRKQALLYIMNPNKFRACEYLIRLHEKRGDKIIVFSDSVFALQTYARKLKRHFICGPTSNQERMDVFHLFKHDPSVKTIFLSKVGDNSIDLPGANVLIQISSHYASRRQEAQRLGRILRPKPQMDSYYNAFFYSIVSKDTTEMYYSAKRQEFLVDQGYAFRVLADLVPEHDTTLCFSSRKEQRDLLLAVKQASDTDAEIEKYTEDFLLEANSQAQSAKRTQAASLAARSGGRQHPLFKKRKEVFKKVARGDLLV